MQIHKLKSNQNLVFRYEVHNEAYNWPQHMHSFVELSLMLDGELVINTRGKKEILRSGQFALILPFQTHSYESQKTSSFIIYTFSQSIISDFLQSIAGKIGEKVVFDATPATLDLFRARLINELDLSNYGVRSCLYSMLSDFSSQVRLCEQSRDNQVLTKLIEYINEHFREQLPLTTVAKAIGYSANYLSHCIYKSLDLNYCSLLASIRVEHAKYLLKSTNLSTIEVALECGFGCERSFNRQFKQITGRTPKNYRSVDKMQIIERKYPIEVLKN